jgi:hypothetical protein
MGEILRSYLKAPQDVVKVMRASVIKKLMGQEGSQLPFEQKFLSGAFAGWIAQTSIYPMEVIKFN